MGLELSMMRLAFLKNSLINKKRVHRGGAKCNSGLINKKWVYSGGDTSYNSGLINEKWVRMVALLVQFRVVTQEHLT